LELLVFNLSHSSKDWSPYTIYKIHTSKVSDTIYFRFHYQNQQHWSTFLQLPYDFSSSKRRFNSKTLFCWFSLLPYLFASQNLFSKTVLLFISNRHKVAFFSYYKNSDLFSTDHLALLCVLLTAEQYLSVSSKCLTKFLYHLKTSHSIF